MELNDFIFPVIETDLQYLAPPPYESKNDLSTWTDVLSHKAIVREDSGELISIVSKNYKLITNEEVLENTVGVVDKLGLPYRIENVSSFISNQRMICHIFFPTYQIVDKDSPIYLTMWIHNSYDMSTRFRFRFGTLRLICSNGALMYSAITPKIFKKHTPNFFIDDIRKEIENGLKQFPAFKEKVDYLQARKIDLLKYKPLAEKIMGSGFAKYMTDEKRWRSIESFYDLYNEMTWYVTHKIIPTQKESYFEKISKAFMI